VYKNRVSETIHKHIRVNISHYWLGCPCQYIITVHICNNPLTIFEGSLNITIPESKGSSVIFLRRTLCGKVESDQGLTFIPTRHLLAIFEEQRGQKTNKEALKLFYALSSHALTRTSAGWIYEKSMHNHLVTSDKALSIFQGSTKKLMQPSSRLLNGTSRRSMSTTPSIGRHLRETSRESTVFLVTRTAMSLPFRQQLRMTTKVLRTESERCGGNSVRRFEQTVFGTLLLSRTRNRLLINM